MFKFRFDWHVNCVRCGLMSVMQTYWVLTIYTGKPEIPVGRSNGSRHSVWEPSENLGFDLW